MLKRNFFKKSNFINLIWVVLVVYLFWSLIGWYLPFRFINYSLGYFIFIALSMLIRNNFKYDYLLILALIVSLLDTIYLDVYNSPEYVVLTFPKLASLLFLFVVMEVELKVIRKFLIRN